MRHTDYAPARAARYYAMLMPRLFYFADYMLHDTRHFRYDIFVRERCLFLIL